VGIVFTIDSALQHTCAEISEQAVRGQVSAAERDLLIDGAILLAVHLEALAEDGRLHLPDALLDRTAEAAGRPALSR
jgi:hypothetical protein